LTVIPVEKMSGRELVRISAAQVHFSAYLEWNNLTCSTVGTSKVPSKRILSNSSGVVKSGEFLAIMGPSGAGKTTLLSYISGKPQKNLKVDSGEILLNKIPIDKLFYKAMIGFVPQQDIILESLTPREAFRFTAQFTVNKPPDIIEKLVDQNLEELGLMGCADRMIGGGLIRGISGGEKKRASIGTELIFNPSVLFLDEPTTGLDSFTSQKLAELLKFLAIKKNRTIVATIHQPNSQIFNQFDKLLLLKNGTTIYMGDALEAIEHFRFLGHPVPMNYNPADHFLKVLSEHDIAPRSTIIPVVGEPNASFHQEIDGERVDVEFDKPAPHYIAGSFFAFRKLCHRVFLEDVRNPLMLKVKISKLFICTLMVSILFFRIDDASDCKEIDLVKFDSDDNKNLRTRIAMLFMIIANFYAEANASMLLSFQGQKYVFFREYSEARYGVIPYFLSYNVVLFPLECLWNIFFVIIVYWTCNLTNHAKNFFVQMALGIIMGMCGTSFGMLCSIIAPGLELAAVLSPLFIIPFNLTAGFLVSNNKIPDWFFMKYISPFRYGLEIGVRNMFDDSPTSHECKHAVIHSLHLPDSDIAGGFWKLILVMISMRTLACIVLWLKVRKL
jgi:ABC-type multidrug transport system ATPase subunit